MNEQDASFDGGSISTASIASYPWPIGVPRGPGYDRPLIISDEEASYLKRRRIQRQKKQSKKS